MLIIFEFYKEVGHTSMYMNGVCMYSYINDVLDFILLHLWSIVWVRTFIIFLLNAVEGVVFKFIPFFGYIFLKRNVEKCTYAVVG